MLSVCGLAIATTTSHADRPVANQSPRDGKPGQPSLRSKTKRTVATSSTQSRAARASGATRDKHALSTIPRLGAAPTLFSQGRAEEHFLRLKGFFTNSRLGARYQGWSLAADIGESPRDPGEYFIELRNDATQETRIVSVREDRVGTDANDVRALAWTRGGDMVIAGRAFAMRDGQRVTDISLSPDAVAGPHAVFFGIPRRAEEHADGTLTIHGTTFDGRATSQRYSATLAALP